ncbi:MAG: cohesin domain-containing protein [Dehalococcoidia bacterium]
MRALRPTAPEGTTGTVTATITFPSTGQTAPVPVGNRELTLFVGATPRLSLPPETNATQGQRVSIPILLNLESVRVPSRFTLRLAYDPALLAFESVSPGSFGVDGEVSASLDRAGELVVSVGVLPESGIGSATLAFANFMVLGSSGQGILGLSAVRAVAEQPNSGSLEVQSVDGKIIVVPLAVAPPPPPPIAPPEVEPPAPRELPEFWDAELWTPKHVAASLVYSTLLGITLTTLATIFNGTVEENRPHFDGWWRLQRRRFGGRWARGAAPRGAASASAWMAGVFGLGVVAYVVAASVLFAFLEPERALAHPTLAVSAAGFAILATTLVSQLPRWAYLERLMRSGTLQPLPQGESLVELRADFWTLAFALLCVGVAYGSEVRPGYAYGIVGVLAVNRHVRVRADGDRGILQAWHMDLLAMTLLLAIAVAAWVGYSTQHAGPEAHGELQVVTAFLERFWVLGAETVALGLIPLAFLPGQSLWRWSRWRWAILWGMALFLYIQSATPHAVGAGPYAIGLTLVAYSIVTIAFWYFFDFLHDEETCAVCLLVRHEPADERELAPALAEAAPSDLDEAAQPSR